MVLGQWPAINFSLHHCTANVSKTLNGLRQHKTCHNFPASLYGLGTVQFLYTYRKVPIDFSESSQPAVYQKCFASVMSQHCRWWQSRGNWSDSGPWWWKGSRLREKKTTRAAGLSVSVGVMKGKTSLTGRVFCVLGVERLWQLQEEGSHAATILLIHMFTWGFLPSF